MLFWQMMKAGGPMMWVIMILSIISLVIFLEKTMQFHREEINSRELLRGLFNVLRRNGLVEAISLCDNTPGPVARMLGAVIAASQRNDSDLQSVADDAALREIPRLERRINLLGSLGFILPLTGFLGTVLGMLAAFEDVSGADFISISTVSAPITSALLTSAAGLSTAVFCHLAYNYLVGRVEAITLDMDRSALEMLNFLDRRRSGKIED